MRRLYRALSSIALILLSLNIAHAGNPIWCGYQGKAKITSATQLNERASALEAARASCIRANIKGIATMTVLESNMNSPLVKQLQAMATTCNTAAKASSLTDPSVNQCMAAYACLKVKATTPTGQQVNVCLKPNPNDQTCTIGVASFYDPNTQSCQTAASIASTLVEGACKAKGQVFTNGTCSAPASAAPAPTPATLTCPAPQVMNAATNSCVPCSAPLIYSKGACVACPAGQTYLTATSSCGTPPPVAAAAVVPVVCSAPEVNVNGTCSACPAGQTYIAATASAPASCVTLGTQAQACAGQYGKGDPVNALNFLEKDVARLQYNSSLSRFNSKITAALNAETACCTALNMALNNDMSCPPPAPSKK